VLGTLVVMSKGIEDEHAALQAEFKDAKAVGAVALLCARSACSPLAAPCLPLLLSPSPSLSATFLRPSQALEEAWNNNSLQLQRAARWVESLNTSAKNAGALRDLLQLVSRVLALPAMPTICIENVASANRAVAAVSSSVALAAGSATMSYQPAPMQQSPTKPRMAYWHRGPNALPKPGQFCKVCNGADHWATDVVRSSSGAWNFACAKRRQTDAPPVVDATTCMHVKGCGCL
jgi:hypothetical protein